MEPQHVDALLIGGGVAAVRCARSLRRAGFSGSIAIVGDEPVPPYNRPPLSKELLRDDVPLDLILAEPPSWYERRGVELLLGVPAASLDPGERLVELADGRRLQYRQCLLALGAEPRSLRVTGAEHALLLRTLADAKAIRARAVAGRSAVVVGGGFIGVEVAGSLAARGMGVTVLELGDALWRGAFGHRVSDWAVRRLAGSGVGVRFSAAVEALSADAALVGGVRHVAELMVAGVGVRPRQALAERAGLEVADGIVVDDRQQTTADGVFAAGDVARHRDGVRVEHWHSARESGERAAAAMLGAAIPPPRAPWVFSDFAGAHLDVVGGLGGWDEEVEVAAGLQAMVRQGIVRQLVILDDAVPADDARALIERGVAPAELRRLLPA